MLDLPVDERLEGTAATVALSIAAGADIVRVHDVKEMVRVARHERRHRARLEAGLMLSEAYLGLGSEPGRQAAQHRRGREASAGGIGRP